MEPYLILSIFAIVSSLLAAFIELVSIRHIDKRLEKEAGKMDEKGTIGKQFGEWLLSTEKQEDGSEVSNLGLCSRAVGHEIARSFSMAAKGIASGDARLERGVERRVLEGLQSPEVNQLLEFCDRIGVDRELAGTVYGVLEKRGLLDGLLKNNGSGEKSTW